MISKLSELLLTASFMKGIGPRALKDLIQILSRDDLSQQNLYGAIENIAQRKRTIDLSKQSFENAVAKSKDQIEKANKLGIDIICSMDDCYPKLLKNSSYDPCLLYVKGNIDNLSSRAIAVIGTRFPSEFGAKFSYRISNYLASNNIVVVSGLALGCDTEAHKGTLAAPNGRTIAVLAHGLDTIAPSQNIQLADEIVQKGGCLISTYPIGTIPSVYTFSPRDKIQAGLSEKVVLIQSGTDGGSLITSETCLEDNRNLVVVRPYGKDLTNNESCIGANFALINAKENNNAGYLSFFKSKSVLKSDFLRRVEILSKKEEYEKIFDTAPFSLNLDKLKENAPRYEVYKNICLNGTNLDYLFLSSKKNSVFLNISTSEADLYRKLKELIACKEHLYLDSTKAKCVTLYLAVTNGSVLKADLNKEAQDNHVHLYTISQHEFNESKICSNVLNEELSEENAQAGDVYSKIKKHLFFSPTQQDFFLDLSKEQKNIIKNDKTKRVRITGCAGSGKSLVVALRAARLLYQGKSVLVTSFNITMMNYLRALIEKALCNPQLLVFEENEIVQEKVDIQKLSIIHFHGFLGNVRAVFCQNANNVKNLVYEETQKNIKVVLDRTPQELIAPKQYDAIIIDEGQDFELLWLEILNKFLKEDGYLMLLADATQDVYSHSKELVKTDGLGFKGRWRKLNRSYRMPNGLINICSDFGSRFIQKDNDTDEFRAVPISEGGVQHEFFGNLNIKWYQRDFPSTRSKDNLEHHEWLILLKIESIIDELVNKKQIPLDDICVLCNSRKFGRKIVESLNENNIPTESIFSDDNHTLRQEKLNMGSRPGSLKCSTIHSFKGWESYNVILVNIHKYTDPEDPKSLSPQKEDQITNDKNCLLYVGLTRVNKNENGENNLIVINDFPEYADFFRNLFSNGEEGQYIDLDYEKQKCAAKVIFYEEIE